MDTDYLIVGALFLLAYAVRAATRGNSIPGYIVALAAGAAGIYASQQDYVQMLTLLAWGICGTAILSIYVGRNIVRIKEG
ncbi:MAG TPA: hypothetical protein VG819_06460 [Rhizomicrobium sp.]|jgi:hypothetical protein|nr:hypothetical protein [Rhizomicrobium sp.]